MKREVTPSVSSELLLWRPALQRSSLCLLHTEGGQPLSPLLPVCCPASYWAVTLVPCSLLLLSHIRFSGVFSHKIQDLRKQMFELCWNLEIRRSAGQVLFLQAVRRNQHCNWAELRLKVGPTHLTNTTLSLQT